MVGFNPGCSLGKKQKRSMEKLIHVDPNRPNPRVSASGFGVNGATQWIEYVWASCPSAVRPTTQSCASRRRCATVDGLARGSCACEAPRGLCPLCHRPCHPFLHLCLFLAQKNPKETSDRARPSGATLQLQHLRNSVAGCLHTNRNSGQSFDHD